MVYSDTKVIWQLLTFAIVLRNSTVTGNNSTEEEYREWNKEGGVVIVMISLLCFIYLVSTFCLLTSPWIASLRTSYMTSMLLQEEDVDMATPVGKDMVYN